MNRFLFITHVTPPAKRNVLRERLFQLHTKSLHAQRYENWQVIRFCADEQGSDGKFHRFLLPDVNRAEKTAALKELLQSAPFQKLVSEADYIVKLDDDDLISPLLLEQLKDFKGDLFYDRYHTFLDCTSGMVTQQERNWIASTCVHKAEHVFAPWSGAGATDVGNLLYTDHSAAWHRYYEGKQIVSADALHPVYLRVLSPTSITSGTHKTSGFADVDLKKYDEYLAAFGDWSRAATNDFDQYLPEVRAAWKEYSGQEQRKLSTSVLKKVKRFGKQLQSKLKRK